MDQLERAARDGRRIVITRRGNEYVVVARRIVTVDGHDAVVGWLPMTGEELVFRLTDIEAFQVVD